MEENGKGQIRGDTVFHRKKLGLYQVPGEGKPWKDLK